MKMEHYVSHIKRLLFTRDALALGCIALLCAGHAAAGDNVLKFTNSGQYIVPPARITTTPFTVEMWVKQFDQPAATERNFLSQYVSGNSGRLILTTQANKSGFHIGDAGRLNGVIALSTNVWYHIAFVRSSAGLNTTYINGVLDAQATKTIFALAPTNISIGALSPTGSGQGYRGLMSDVRVWNVARTQSEIQNAMSTRLAGTETGLSYYWKMNEGSGSVIADTVTAANGNIIGATWSFSDDLPFSTTAAAGAWSAASGGNWSDTSKWSGGISASGADSTAFFTNTLPSAISVTNDVSNLKLGHLIAHGPAHTFTGNAIIFTNEFVVPRLVTALGAHAVETPLPLTAAGLSIEAMTPGAFDLSGLISGSGGLAVNPASSGGGLVTLAGANTFTGPTVLGCGTLSVATLPNGGAASPVGASSADAANLRLGPGTFHYSGDSAATDRGFTVQAGSNPARAAVLRTDADLTFGGQIRAASGCLIKTGSGTVAFTYPGLNVYAAAEGNPNAFQNLNANGDSPTAGFPGLVISNGKIVMGTAGQTNQFVNRIDIGAYTTTNASAETTGELVIAGGVLTCPTTFSVGRHNGTSVTAGPAGLSARFTVSGGYALVSLLAMGNNGLLLPGYNARPVVEVSGGELEINNYLNAGEHPGSLATVNIRDSGVLRLTGTTDYCARIGLSGAAVVTLSDAALIHASTDLRLSYNTDGSGTLNLDGGTLVARNILKGTGTNAVVNFNGGVFKPHTAGRTLAGLTAAAVAAGGVRLDTSLADYTVAQNLSHDAALGETPDGGLIKLGNGTLTLSCGAPTYTGPTVVSNGTLKITGALPDGNALTVAPDGALFCGGSATQVVTAASLSLEGVATLAFALALDGSTNDRLSITTSPILGSGRVALYQPNSELPFTRNGTYTFLTYTGADPDAGGLAAANPVFGKTYTFAASGGNVTVTIATDTTGAAVWKVNAGGAWADDGNWGSETPPADNAGSRARFDNAISAPVTVSTSGETVGEIYFNNSNTYTLGGSGLTLDNDGVPASLSVESGTHALTAPLTLASPAVVTFTPGSALTLGSVSGASSTLTAQGNGNLVLTDAPDVQALILDVTALGLSNTMTITPPITLLRTITVNPATGTTATLDGMASGSGGLTQAGSSFLVPSVANTYSGPTAINAGTLRVATLANGGSASAIGAAPAASANLILGKGTLHITGPATTDRGYTVRTGSPSHAAVLRADGDVTFGGQIKSESGAFLKTGPGTVAYTYPGANTLNTNDGGSPGGLQNIGPYGDAPTAGVTGFTITQGRVVFGAPNQTNSVNRIDIGLYTTTQPGQETAGELIVTGGVLNSANTVSVGRNNGTTSTAPTGVSSRLKVSGGICNFATLASGNNGANLTGYNARPVIEVTGGRVNVGGDYLSVGESAGSFASLLVSGGTVSVHKTTGTIRMGGWSGAGGNGYLALSGDGVIEVATLIEMGFGTGGTAEVRLDGGTLTARNFVKGSGTSADVIFNGGLFRPSLTNQTLSGLTAATVSTNGAWFDTTLADGYTVAQNLSLDPALGGAADGGLVKLGTNTLSLTGAGNTFNGLVDIRGGLLRARLGATNDLNVAPGAAFDALGFRCAVRDLTGTGLLTNGVIAVTGTLDAGTNGAPAGARMTVQNLSLVGGATFACPWATNALGHVTNDFVAVTGTLAAEGPGFIDLGRTEASPIPMPFTATILSYTTFSGSFAGWKVVNTGLPSGLNIAFSVTANSGLVKITVQYGGTLLLLH